MITSADKLLVQTVLRFHCHREAARTKPRRGIHASTDVDTL